MMHMQHLLAQGGDIQAEDLTEFLEEGVRSRRSSIALLRRLSETSGAAPPSSEGRETSSAHRRSSLAPLLKALEYEQRLSGAASSHAHAAHHFGVDDTTGGGGGAPSITHGRKRRLSEDSDDVSPQKLAKIARRNSVKASIMHRMSSCGSLNSFSFPGFNDLDTLDLMHAEQLMRRGSHTGSTLSALFPLSSARRDSLMSSASSLEGADRKDSLMGFAGRRDSLLATASSGLSRESTFGSSLSEMSARTREGLLVSAFRRDSLLGSSAARCDSLALGGAPENTPEPGAAGDSMSYLDEDEHYLSLERAMGHSSDLSRRILNRLKQSLLNQSSLLSSRSDSAAVATGSESNHPDRSDGCCHCSSSRSARSSMCSDGSSLSIRSASLGHDRESPKSSREKIASHKPSSQGENNKPPSSEKPSLNAFILAMERSRKSQEMLHDWDKKMGLKRSHSKTMRMSRTSRKGLLGVLGIGNIVVVLSDPSVC